MAGADQHIPDDETGSWRLEQPSSHEDIEVWRKYLRDLQGIRPEAGSQKPPRTTTRPTGRVVFRFDKTDLKAHLKMNSTQRRVVVGVPTMGAMHPDLVATLLQWAREFRPEELSFYFTFKVSPVDRARNSIVRFFLEAKVLSTHLLFIDADTIPPVDGLKRLLSHDKDIVSGLTPILHYDPKTKSYPTFDNCFTHVETAPDGTKKTQMAERHTGLQPIFRCGSSCVLIKREVFETLEKPYYQFTYNEDGTQHTRSEDLGFCDRAREAGFELWADTDVVCQHYKDVMI